MRFSTRMLLLQLACVIAVVAICTAVFVWLGVAQLRAEAQSSALSIARTVAADADVRAGVSRVSADQGTPTAAELRGGALESLAASAEESTGALFVVITDDQGIRLAHPDPALLGQVVSTSFAEALAGRESVSWESGTLGESARAKVPVRDLDTDEPVGEVSVGFAPVSVFNDLPLLLSGIGFAAAAALALGVVVSLILRRRLEHLTLGLQPEELATLVQNQAAVLDGVGDGVLAYTPDGIVTVANTTAGRLLGTPDLVGRSIRDLPLPPAAREAMTGVRTGVDAGEPIVLADHIVFIDAHPVSRADRDLGLIVVIRDRTDVVDLTERLATVASMTEALRVQRHEFANRLHVAAGLIDADRVSDARDYLDDVRDESHADAVGLDTERVSDPFLVSFVESLALRATERGVRLSLRSDSLVLGTVAKPEDVATVLANLVDNAVNAAVSGPAVSDAAARWVSVELLDDADSLVLTVSDSGAGIAEPDALFSGRERDVDPGAVHGRGIGLPLARQVARRLGGDVWLVSSGGDTAGAIFSARLPGVMHAMPARASEGESS